LSKPRCEKRAVVAIFAKTLRVMREARSQRFSS
jgi:hypothetical protein